MEISRILYKREKSNGYTDFLYDSFSDVFSSDVLYIECIVVDQESEMQNDLFDEVHRALGLSIGKGEQLSARSSSSSSCGMFSL